MNAPTPHNPLSTLITMLESIALHGNIRNVLLCVSGSIAAYKALELASMLKKLHINVAVVMSESAKKFITPLSFEALTHHKVLHEQSEDWSAGAAGQRVDSRESSGADVENLDTFGGESLACNHIAYARWAQLCILAPASASSIAKLAHGVADTLIIQTLLATQAPIICAPAMNTQMLLSKQTQANLAMLKELGVQIIAPRVGLLACSTTGAGALASVEEILFGMLSVSMSSAKSMSSALESSLDSSVSQESSAKSRLDSGGESSNPKNAARFWRDRDVCITGGGASAMIDSVRAITNHSSGLQASALAIALHSLGARVTLIASAFPLPLPEAVRKVHATSNADYERAILQVAQERSERAESSPSTKHSSKHSWDSRVVLFMAAALVDFAPESISQSKIKKHQNNGTLTLKLAQSRDILAGLDSREFVKIGFKAEDTLESALPNAMSMLYPSDEIHEGRRGKGCEVVCLNTLESNPFGAMDNRFTLLNRQSLHDSSAIVQLESDSKLALAYKIAHFVQATLESSAATSHAKP